MRGAKRWRVPAQALRRAVEVTLAKAAPRVRGEVTVVLTDDRGIARLNGAYRGKDRPTDVLSFPIGDGRDKGEAFGDVVISVETARRQARDYDAPLLEELQRLLVHGVLHLCGHDHHERREAARMHALTRGLVRALRAARSSARRATRAVAKRDTQISARRAPSTVTRRKSSERKKGHH